MALSIPTRLPSLGPGRGVVRASVPDGALSGRRVLPSPTLSPFVHHYWWVRWALRSPFTAEILTHPTAQLLVERQAQHVRAEIVGLTTGRVTTTREAEGEVFGVTFRPAMFQPILRASMLGITDRVVPAHDIFGAAGGAWGHAILDEGDLEAKVAIAERFLADRIPHVPTRLLRLRDLVERMAVDRTLVRVEDVAAAADVDVRALQRRFRRYVGVHPKWVIQRYRLHEAAVQLRSATPPALAELAAALGYADQSHFAREFKAVVGRTPGEISTRRTTSRVARSSIE